MGREDMPMLIVYQGKQEGQRWLIYQDLVTIGRGSDCEVIISERQVSRHHAQIDCRTDGYYLRDLGSKNGTYPGGG